MLARSSAGVGFSPSERPRVVVAADGTLAAIQEPSTINVVEVPSCAQFAELGTDPAASACEVAWVGTPPRLLVLSRFDAHSIVHLVDPFGPRTIAEIRLESPMKLYAAVGGHALAIGAAGAAILAASDRALTPYQFPARAVPAAAGAAGGQFVVAMPGALEEWDPQTRMPRRRLKLPHPASITAVGGSGRVVWMTTQQHPARIDVVPLVNRGQPKVHDLPEPIASVASHPRTDMIVCIGATTGRVWIVDLDGRAGVRTVATDGIEGAEAIGLVLGRVTGILAAQANRAITVVALDRSDAAGGEVSRAKVASMPPPTVRSALYGDDDAADSHEREEGPTRVTLAAPQSTLAAPQVTDAVRDAGTESAQPVDRPGPGDAAVAASRSDVDSPFAARPKTDKAIIGARPAEPRSASAGSPPAETSGARPTTPPTDAAGVRPSTPPPLFGSAPLASPAAVVAERQSAGARRGSAETIPFTPAASPSPAPAARSDGTDARRGSSDTIPFTPAASPSPAPATRSDGADARREHYVAWRERVEHPRARTLEPSAALWPDASSAWRDDIAAWARAVTEHDGGSSPPSSPIEALATRFDVSARLEPVLALLYGQHLRGDTAAPIDVARLLGGDWAEALGRGELARTQIATYHGSRVRLADVVQRALDELPPRTGTLVGTPGVVSLLGPCVIVAAGPLAIIAEACVSSIGGAILASHADADPQELAFEARAYGAAPLWRVRAEQLAVAPSEQPIILVAPDDATADLLGVPRLT